MWSSPDTLVGVTPLKGNWEWITVIAELVSRGSWIKRLRPHWKNHPYIVWYNHTQAAWRGIIVVPTSR